MGELTLHQKACAMNALASISIQMDMAHGWFVKQSVEQKRKSDSSILEGICGRGETPDEALADHWDHLIDLPIGAFLVINAYDDRRRHVRWNGYMWADLPL
jgi:hypothetical protein